jgi:hypothetical protein
VSRLRTLATALEHTGLTAALEDFSGSEVYLRVTNPDAPDCCDRITCQHHPVDGYALWLYHSWGEPISPACDISTAVADITAMLQPRPGGRSGRS